MSGRRIQLCPGARTELLGLDKPVRRRLQRAVDGLAECAQPAGAVAVAGLPGGLRLRVGDYQVIYTVDEQEVLILVIDVDRRSSQWAGIS